MCCLFKRKRVRIVSAVVLFMCVVLVVVALFLLEKEIDLTGVPDYLMLEVEYSIKTLRKQQIISRDCIILPVYTDAHTTGTDDTKMSTLTTCIQAVTNNINCDYIISLGDELHVDWGRRDHKSNQFFQDTLTMMHRSMSELSDTPFIPINGNHDGIGADFFDKDLWCNTLGEIPDSGRSTYTRNVGEPYFYVDYPKEKLRLIFMSIPSGADFTSDSNHPQPIWAAGIEQLEWLVGEALDTDDGYSVILFSHVPTCYYAGAHDETYEYATWNGKEDTTTSYYDLMGRVEDQKTIEGIFTAYHNHSTYTDEFIVCDFSRYTSTEVVLEVAGHVHCDSVVDAGSVGNNGIINGMPCKIVTIGSCTLGGNGSMTGWEDLSVVYDKSDGTDSEILFDVMVINPNIRKISFVRIGPGGNRYVTY